MTDKRNTGRDDVPAEAERPEVEPTEAGSAASVGAAERADVGPDEDEPAESSDPGPVPPVAPAAPAPTTPSPHPRTGTLTARRAAVTGLRLLTGVVGVVASVAVIAAVGLVPLPDVGRAAPAQRIVPVPTDLSSVCPGALLRLGGTAGADAATAASVGRAAVTTAASGTSAERATLTPSATDAQVLTAAPGDGAALGGAQSQRIATDQLLGLAATGCREASGTTWLVGGATTTGRTTLVTLSNPTDVSATVELRIWGENGAVDAAGMSGIVVAPRSQRVLSLAGFAQDVASPVVEVVSRGGRIVATLQESVIRTLDPGGVELTGDTAAPARSQTIAGVRIVAPEAVGSLLGLADYGDTRTVLRLLAPEQATSARVVLRPAGGGDARTSNVPLDAGTVLDVPLDDLTAGTWSVEIDADAPVVASVRASTASPLTGSAYEAPVSDLAWFPASEPLDGATLLAVADGPSPELAIANPGSSARTATLHPLGTGPDTEIRVPARSAVVVDLDEDAGYRLTGASGLVASVSLGGDGQLAAYPVASPRAVSGPIVIRR